MNDLIRTNSHIAMNRSFGTQELNDILVAVMGRENKETKKKSFAPSGLSYNGTCPRYWYYAFNGAQFEYDNDGPSISNMDAGSAAGERIAKLFEKAGLLIEAEKEVRHEDPPIFGYMDMLINWKGEQVPVEVKTTNDRNWNNRMNKNAVPGYQLLQLLIYMYVFGHQRGFFYTENKDSNEVFILPIRMNDEYKALVEATFEWMRMVHKNALEGSESEEAFEAHLPTRPFTRSSFQCKGCPVRNTCWPEDYKRGKVNGNDSNPGTIDLPVLEVPK